MRTVTQGTGQEGVKTDTGLGVTIPSVISDSDGLLQVGAQVLDTGLDVGVQRFIHELVG